MAKTYFPHSEKVAYVSASSPHPENTQYKVSLGLEIWGGENHEVAKIQMVYDGVIAGRRSPSFPTGTDDFHRVSSKIQELITSR
jgi:hypothetical protein